MNEKILQLIHRVTEKRKPKTDTILLVLIFATGLFLRLHQLKSIPVGFHLDEASKGYSGYSILKTGRDDNNHVFPLYIDIFGDNSPAGYHYLTIFPVALMGLTETAVRLPGALIGALSIPVFFYFTLVIFNNRKISLLSALFLSISPWHINLSRASSESLVALFFILLGFSLVFRSLKNQSIKSLFSGTCLASLSFFFYQTPRVFVPMIFLATGIFIFLIWKMKMFRRYQRAFIISFIFLLILDFLLIFIFSGGTGRFNQVNIFSFPETRLVQEELIREDGLLGNSILMTRFFHNKVVSYSLTYIGNYLEYFTWNFLFVKGLPDWYFIPGMGVMYLIQLPLVFLGLFSIIIEKNRWSKLILVWLILGPMTAAITVDTNNLQRALVMFPMLEITAVLGLNFLFTKVKNGKRSMLLGFVMILFVLNFSYFIHQYFSHTKVHHTWYRYNGFAGMVLAVKEDYDAYDQVIITKTMGGLYPLVQFYTQYDPKLYLAEGSPKDKDFSGFGKFFFVPYECPSQEAFDRVPRAGRIIYVNSGTCPQDANFPEKIIHREDGTDAFRLVYQDHQISPDLYYQEKNEEKD